MPLSLQGAAVVITGASSGIGRAAAHAFAQEGARLVMAARGEAALEEAARECRALGAEALVRSLETSDTASVDRLAEEAVREYGRIDIWVNNAATLLLGRFEDLPADVFQHAFDNNFVGYVNGARAALRQFRAQGDRGSLINVVSILALVGAPDASPYVASKFAMRGFAACLRQELRDAPAIHICNILPAAVDTPIYQHAGNFSGRQARSIMPVYSPEKVARRIIAVAKRPRRQAIVGSFAWMVAAAAAVAPRAAGWMVARLLPVLQFQDARQPPTRGNVFESLKDGYSVSGGWQDYWSRRAILRRRRNGS